MSDRNPLSSEEGMQLVSLLNRATWPLPPAIFDATLGIIPTVAFELVVISQVNAGRGHTEPRVLLLPRPENDPFFKGMVHSPGTVMRLGDTVESALKRVMSQEVDDSVGLAWFVGVTHVPKGPLPDGCPRGQEVGLVYFARWKGGALPKGAMWGDPNNLPSNIIGYHRPIIAMAMKRYEEIAQN